MLIGCGSESLDKEQCFLWVPVFTAILTPFLMYLQVAPALTNMEEADGSPEDKQLTYFSDAVPINQDGSILSAEVVKNLKTAVEKGNWNEVVSIVKDINEETSKSTVKIAVTGDSGNGISSFINALRHIGHEEEDSAPTGVVRTTQKPACYFSSIFPNVDLWDLPGTGVTAQSVEDYLEEMEFDKYDLIIIIASEQFSSNHVKLAKAIQGMRKRLYVIWTKLDSDLSTSTHSQPQLLRRIQESIQENLQKEGVKGLPIFLVSNLEPSSYDFPKLGDTLRKDISNIRYDGLFEILFHICEQTINEKVESINRNIDVDNLRDLGILNPDNLGECEEVFKGKFGVDDRSLHHVAQNMSQPDASPSQDIPMYQQDSWTISWLYHSGTQYISTSLDTISCCVNSHHRRRMQQKHVLEEVAKKTKKILWEILRVHLPTLERLDN
ncbi:hypothetical protein STEG23_013776 [Scotinomys teguina]